MMAKDKKEKKDVGFEVTMTKARDTKGTFVYKDDNEGAPIRSLYITKDAFGEGDAPDKLTVTVAAA